MNIFLKRAASVSLVVVLGLLATTEAAHLSRPITVRNPNRLPGELKAERIPIGVGRKPVLALLPGGELIMMDVRQEPSGSGFHEFTVIRRSSDKGLTWSAPVRVEKSPGQDLLGREQWLTVVDNGTSDGILFSTATLLEGDTSNPVGYLHSYISRSTDGGRSWTQTRVGPAGWSGSTPNTMTTRNVVEMPNGDLLFGVADFLFPGTEAYTWTSSDQGVTWQQSAQVAIPSYVNYEGTTQSFQNLGSFFSEAFLYLDQANELTSILRLDVNSPLFPMSSSPPVGDDSNDRMLITRSTDAGMTWSVLEDLGDASQDGYGQHYPRVLRLNDGRLMMTYTKRGVTEPLGLRAVFSDDDGQTWNFESDLLILDENTPSGLVSGGGFGNTIQWADNAFVSAYSYNPETGVPQIEVVRWTLPVPVPEPSTLMLLFGGGMFLYLATWRKRTS